jgi:hypothetical protein
MIQASEPTTDLLHKSGACTDACQWVTILTPGIYGRRDVVLHDGDIHEQYGRRQAKREYEDARLTPTSMCAYVDGVLEPWDVATGPLLVRPSSMCAYVDGVDARLTPIEWRLLRELARNLGHVVPPELLIVRVWGRAPDEGVTFHCVRVNVARLRAKLGAARALLETKPGFGYRLVSEPYTGPLP